MSKQILSVHYLPCVYWFRQLLAGNALLDANEHYLKQSYRNRSIILSANGPLALTVPVKKDQPKQAVKDMGIENDFNWQKQHWEAIRSAYGASPFYMHYAPKLEPLYAKSYNSLLALNLDSIHICLQLLKQPVELTLAHEYVIPSIGDTDLRELIHPKRMPDAGFRTYLQVFSEKLAFVPNLSIIDVLFNHGPAATRYILP